MSSSSFKLELKSCFERAWNTRQIESPRPSVTTGLVNALHNDLLFEFLSYIFRAHYCFFVSTALLHLEVFFVATSNPTQARMQITSRGRRPGNLVSRNGTYPPNDGVDPMDVTGTANNHRAQVHHQGPIRPFSTRRKLGGTRCQSGWHVMQTEGSTFYWQAIVQGFTMGVAIIPCLGSTLTGRDEFVFRKGTGSV
ncbi:hypothetical protein EDB84DRAFT_1443092 [Lactarius hengduanensis]|nr:hypothetical protein EDB84DRAFT_1443092 [Lactarius hengduanensis]